MDEVEFNKKTVIESLKNEKTFALAKDFIVSGGISQYPMTEAEQEILVKIDDPKEFAFKFMELALAKWFQVTRGE